MISKFITLSAAHLLRPVQQPALEQSTLRAFQKEQQSVVHQDTGVSLSFGLIVPRKSDQSSPAARIFLPVSIIFHHLMAPRQRHGGLS